jgi:excisionase family DNA binding protein
MYPYNHNNREDESMNKETKQKLVPIWERINLTLEEAAAYSGIGVGKLRELTNEPDCDYVLWIGGKRLLKRKQFEKYLEKQFSI